MLYCEVNAATSEVGDVFEADSGETWPQRVVANRSGSHDGPQTESTREGSMVRHETKKGDPADKQIDRVLSRVFRKSLSQFVSSNEGVMALQFG